MLFKNRQCEMGRIQILEDDYASVVEAYPLKEPG